MTIPVVSCGIFRWELAHLLPELQKKTGVELAPRFLPAGMDMNERDMEAAIRTEASKTECGSPAPGTVGALLFGSMCHTNMAGIASDLGAVFPKDHNCAELLLGPAKKRELDATGNLYYLTAGGFHLWREIYQQAHGWSGVDARMNFAGVDRIVVLDTGILPIVEEELFELFEYTQVPVEVEPITLDYFKSVLIDLCNQATAAGPAR